MSAAAKKVVSRSNMGVFRLWLTDAGTFPVLFCATVGAIGCSITAYHAIRKNPDVRIDKDKRRNAMSYNDSEGVVWRQNRFKFANYDRNPINQSKQYDQLYHKPENQGVKR